MARANINMYKKIVYVDMDNVLVDFQTGIDKLSEAEKAFFEGRYDEVPNIFSKMEPIVNRQHKVD